MKLRLYSIMAVLVIGAAWFFLSPLIGLAALGSAVASKNPAALDKRVDFTRLGRSLAPQIVWTYLQKTGRANVIGRTATSMIAGSSGSIADPILGDLLKPEAILRLLETGQPGPQLQLTGSIAALPNGNFGSLWQAFQNAEYGIGNFYLNAPGSAAAPDQYRLHMQVLRWNWKLVGIDLPEKVREQLADELIRRIGK
jgi:Protein of unknown function (DUF2939)